MKSKANNFHKSKGRVLNTEMRKTCVLAVLAKIDMKKKNAQ